MTPPSLGTCRIRETTTSDMRMKSRIRPSRMRTISTGAPDTRCMLPAPTSRTAMPKATNGTAVSDPRAMSPMMMPRSRKLLWIPSSIRWWTPATSMAPARPPTAPATTIDITATRPVRTPWSLAARSLSPTAVSSKPATDRFARTAATAASRATRMTPTCIGGRPRVGSSAPTPMGRVTAPPAPGSDHTTDAKKSRISKDTKLSSTVERISLTWKRCISQAEMPAHTAPASDAREDRQREQDDQRQVRQGDAHGHRRRWRRGSSGPRHRC